MKRILMAAAVFAVATSARAVTCTWRAVPTNIAFGTYSVFGGAVTATSSFRIRCSPPGFGNVTLSRGASATYARAMPNTATPADTLGYNLYRDAAGLNTWGDGTSGTTYFNFVPTPGDTERTVTIFGIIPANLDAVPGTYSDTIQATLSWGGGSDSRFFTVTANILAECSVQTAPLNFGNYDPVGANAATALTNTSIMQVFCTKGTNVTVTLDNGLWAAGATRRMRHATNADLLTYEIYKDASRTIVWNTTNTNAGTSTSKVTAINGGFTAYGLIPAAQDIRAGNYGDTLQVTVNY